MPVPKKPDNMPWITPYMIVADAAKALNFYVRAFGFHKRFEMKGPNGRIMHAELQHRDGVIMLGEPGPAMPHYAPPHAYGGVSISVYVYVDDVDALFNRAAAAAAKIERPPADMFYGDRACALIDADGHRWGFATHIKDVAPEDLKPPGM